MTHEPDVAQHANRLLEIRDGLLLRDAPTSQIWPGQAPQQQSPLAA